MKVNRVRHLLVMVTILSLMPITFVAWSQSKGSQQGKGKTVTGTISSASGAIISNCRVSVKNSRTGNIRILRTKADGTYTVSGLPPGAYEIVASAHGFATSVTTVTLSGRSSTGVSLVLQPADSAEAAQTSGGSSTVGGVVNSKSVSDLPLNGRSASDLATLEPGVATARTQATGQGNRGFGNQMTISGGRPRQNDSRLDGISVNDYVNGPPGSALGVSLGSDAVEQFTVLSSNYPAQFGRSSGGIIGASTRSGTNQFHGSAFEFLRNSAFDARNFFDAEKPAFHRNQFGGSIGGPILKSRIFFFADYEGLRQSLGITQVDTVPSAEARAGKFSSGHVDPTILRFINAFYPLPNGPLLGAGETGVFKFAGQSVTPEDYFTTKLDYNFSANDALSGTYMFDSGTVRQADELNNKRTGYDSHRQFLALHETHTFSSGLLNSFRFGINRVVANTGLTFGSGNPLAEDPSFGTVPGRNAAGILVPGLTTFSGGVGAIGSYNFHWTSIQAYDDVSLTRGAHTWQFGGGIERIRDNILATTDPSGNFSFNSLSDFLTNHPFFLTATIPGTISERGFRQSVVGAYIQDNWRLRKNVTVNFGLRYEMSTVPTEVHGKLTALRQLTDAAPHLGDPLFENPTRRNFEPRVGVSWDPFSDGKTSISSGFGVFDVLPLPYLIQFNELFSAPFYDFGNVTNLPAGSFPNTAFDIVAASSNTFRQAYFDPKPHRNYVMQWNLSVEREIAKDTNVRIGFVGSRGVHQPFRVEDADIVLPTRTPEGYLWPSPAGSGTRINLNSGRITAGFWNGNSFYDALQVQLKEKIGQGFQLGGSYTWGKIIDTSSGSLVGDEYANSIGSPLWFDPKLNRGLADFNIAHNLEISSTWDLGTQKRASKLRAQFLGGWQIGGVFEASTGVPFTPGFAGDALGVRSTDPDIDVPNLSHASGCGSLVNPGNSSHYIKTQCFSVPNPITLRGNLGRNTLIGPGLMNLDGSLFKNNYIKRISDTFNAQLRAEFFNVSITRILLRPWITNTSSTQMDYPLRMQG